MLQPGGPARRTAVHIHFHGVETTLHEIGVAGPVRSLAVFAYPVQKGKSREQNDIDEGQA